MNRNLSPEPSDAPKKIPEQNRVRGISSKEAGRNVSSEVAAIMISDSRSQTRLFFVDRISSEGNTSSID